MTTPAPTDPDRWTTLDDLHDAGYRPAGPEIDFGHVWGRRHSIRATWAPLPGGDHGFLYAYDKRTDQARLLVADCTVAAAHEAWRHLGPDDAGPDGHLVLAAMIGDDEVLQPDHADALWQHCLTREIDIRRVFLLQTDPAPRLDVAQDVTVAERARISAEALQADAITAVITGGDPVQVRYRFPHWPGWVGRYTATDLDAAATHAADLRLTAAHAGFAAQVTSASVGHTTLASARIPELAFAASIRGFDAPDIPTLRL